MLPEPKSPRFTVDDALATAPAGDVTIESAHHLDNPVWASLRGPHQRFADARGGAAMYRGGVSPFAAVADATDGQHWDDLRSLTAGRPVAVVKTASVVVPEHWSLLTRFDVLQMVHHQKPSVPARGDRNPSLLTQADVPAMLGLVDETQPGPFLPETNQLGRYFGIRADTGELIAMAGQRFDTGAWQEVSAVCTRPAHRGQGLADAVVRRVLDDIRTHERRAFLHVATSNPAASLYRRLGFTVRKRLRIDVIRVP